MIPWTDIIYMLGIPPMADNKHADGFKDTMHSF